MSTVDTRADARDMVALHNGFRREFTALPEVVRRVAAGDRERTAVVADHAAFLFTALHVHHAGEDRVVWPLLLERVPDDLHPLIEKVESQHAAIDRVLRDARERVAGWRDDPTAEERRRVAAALDAVVPALLDHLDLEEREVVPLIDRHLSAAEWASVAAGGQKELSPAQLMMILGMAMAAATPEQRAVIREGTPAPLYLVVSRIGPWLYGRRSRRIHT